MNLRTDRATGTRLPRARPWSLSRLVGPVLLCSLALTQVARAEEEEERDGREEVDDAFAHRRVQRALRGEMPPDAMIRVLEATQRERGRVGRPGPMPGASGVNPALAVPGNAWVNLGPTGSANDVLGAGRVTTQAGRLRSIVPHPTNPDILYVADAGGGVWKTYDARATPPHWEPITDALGTLACGALALDPNAPDNLYLGMGDFWYQSEPGITYSRDGGATWAPFSFLVASYTIAGKVTPVPALSVRDIKVDPNNSAHVIAGADAGLFQSLDAGQTWSHVPLKDNAGAVNPYEIWSISWMGGSSWLVSGALPVSDATAGTSSFPGQLGLWRSSDNGATWSFNNTALPSGANNLGRATIALAPSTVLDPSTTRAYLMATAADTSSSSPAQTDELRDVYRTDDGGKTFIALGVNASKAPTNPLAAMFASQVDMNITQGQGVYDQTIVVDPRDPDLIFMGGEQTSARSKDGGLTWNLMSFGYPFESMALPYAHPDFHAMAIGGAGGDEALWIGNDGGLYRSLDAFTASDNGAHFDESVNKGLVTLEPYSVACAPETWPDALQGYTAGGLQDNGMRIRIGNSTLFDLMTTEFGDGTNVIVSRDTGTLNGAPVPAVLLGGSFGTIYRSVNGGSFIAFMGGIPTTNGQAQLPELPLYARDDAATDPQTFLTASGPPSSAVYKSVAGSQWTKIVGTVHNLVDGTTRGAFVPPGSAPLAIHALTAYNGKSGVYAAASNRYSFITTDAGANWSVGVQVGTLAGTAPDGTTQLSGIAFDPKDSTFSTLYISSRAYTLPSGDPIPDSYGHLYKTTDKGLTWQPVVGSGATALPNVPATSVQFDPNDAHTIYVGTRAGLYRSVNDGVDWTRFGSGLPLAEVSGVCIAPASGNMKVSLWGRGFWELNIGASGNPAGVRGKGDMNHHLRLDGFDLIDLTAVLGATQASPGYLAEADIVGAVNAVDDDDLTAFFTRFGGTP